MPVPSNSILSWKDQVKKENIKILEPSIIVPKEEKVIIIFIFKNRSLYEFPERKKREKSLNIVLDTNVLICVYIIVPPYLFYFTTNRKRIRKKKLYFHCNIIKIRHFNSFIVNISFFTRYRHVRLRSRHFCS